MGTALVRANDLQRGQAYIDRLFREGDPAEAHLLMGAAHLRAERQPVGGSRAGEGRRGEPDAARGALAAGARAHGRGAARRGQGAFERELARNPNDFDSNLYLGLFLKDEGRLDEAQEHLKRAGRLRSQDPAVLYMLARCTSRRGAPRRRARRWRR